VGSEKNPFEDYLEKRSGFMTGMRQGAREFAGMGGESAFQGVGEFIGARAAKGALGAGAAAAGTAGVALAALGVHKLFDAATKTRDFNSMLEYAPDIAEAHMQDPRQINQLFSTLRTFNPDFTRDPVVSSHYVRRMLSDPMAAGGVATEALGHRGEMKHELSSPILRSAFSGGGMGGGEKKKDKKK
jgi:hypothetical protein